MNANNLARAEMNVKINELLYMGSCLCEKIEYLDKYLKQLRTLADEFSTVASQVSVVAKQVTGGDV